MLSRRRVLSTAFGALGLAALGAACGAPTPPTPTSAPAPAKPAEAPKPTEAPKPAEAAKPTEAPKPATEAAKPAEAPKPTVPPSAAAKPAGGAAVQIVVWHTQLDPWDEVIRALMASFSKDRPNVTFDYQVQRRDDYSTKMLPQLAAGTGPDIFEAGPDRLQRFAQGGVMAPVDYAPWGGQSAFEGYWEPGTLDAIRVEGKDYSLPQQALVFEEGFFLNTEMADQAGINWKPWVERPITWDEIAEQTPKMTIKDASGRITRDGFMIQHGFGAGRLFGYWEPQFRQLGGQLLSEDGKKSTLNSDAGVAALQYLSDLIYKHGASMLRPQDKESATGKLPKFETASAIALGYWTYPTLQRLAPDKWTAIKAMVGPPQTRGRPEIFDTGVGTILAVHGKSPKRAESFAFLKHYFDNSGEVFAKAAIVAPVKDWLKKFPGTDKIIDGKAWSYQASRATLRKRHPNEWPTATARTEAFLPAFEAVAFNKTPVKQALDKWNDEVNAALKDL